MPSVGGERSSTPASTSSPSDASSSSPVEHRPGAAAELLARIADSGISIDLLYLTADSQLVIGGDDPDGIRRALG